MIRFLRRMFAPRQCGPNKPLVGRVIGLHDYAVDALTLAQLHDRVAFIMRCLLEEFSIERHLGRKAESEYLSGPSRHPAATPAARMRLPPPPAAYVFFARTRLKEAREVLVGLRDNDEQGDLDADTAQFILDSLEPAWSALFPHVHGRKPSVQELFEPPDVLLEILSCDNLMTIYAG